MDSLEASENEDQAPPLTPDEVAEFRAFKAAYYARLAASAAGAPEHVQSTDVEHASEWNH